jgi:hypothetical protein
MPSSNNVETMFVQHLGQNKSLLQVITVYRPNFKDAAQFQTIYLQHCKRFLLEQRQLQCGLNNFSRLIHEWMDAGEHKVLMMDANEDVQTGETSNFLSTQTCKMLLFQCMAMIRHTLTLTDHNRSIEFLQPGKWMHQSRLLIIWRWSSGQGAKSSMHLDERATTNCSFITFRQSRRQHSDK